jgi:RNA polymerase sigma-70 factor (ECF subfamily)
MVSTPDEGLNTTLRLVLAVQDGSSTAMDDLVERHLPRVRQVVALRMGFRLRQLFDHEDVVQGVMLRVLGGVHNFEHRGEGSFRNWLARCIEHELIDLLRGAQREKRGGGDERRFGDCPSSLLPSAVFADDSPTPSEFARAEELADSIEEHLLALPEHHREIIILRCVCGMSFAEISEELGFSKEGSGRVAFSRAVQRLREAVGV